MRKVKKRSKKDHRPLFTTYVNKEYFVNKRVS